VKLYAASRVFITAAFQLKTALNGVEKHTLASDGTLKLTGLKGMGEMRGI